MKILADMLWIELRKAARSRVPLFITLGSLFMPLGIAFMIFVSKNPDIARKLGLISTKARLMADLAINWPAYLGLLAQMVAAGGFILFVLIISWVFGREFSDGTLKEILAVPVQRSTILLAKFITAAAWAAALTLFVFIFGLGMGAMIGLPQGLPGVLLQGSLVVLVTAGLTLVAGMPFAFFASAGRGYLLPFGVAILALIMANVVTVAGWGQYFPWAVPGLYSQAKDTLLPASYWIVVLTGLAGILATYLWWKFADQSR